MPEFDVREHDDGVELLPDFFTGELSREDRKVYRELQDKLTTENGGLIISGGNFEPGERVSLSEVYGKVCQKNATQKLADKLASHGFISYQCL